MLTWQKCRVLDATENGLFLSSNFSFNYINYVDGWFVCGFYMSENKKRQTIIECIWFFEKGSFPIAFGQISPSTLQMHKRKNIQSMCSKFVLVSQRKDSSESSSNGETDSRKVMSAKKKRAECRHLRTDILKFTRLYYIRSFYKHVLCVCASRPHVKKCFKRFPKWISRNV